MAMPEQPQQPQQPQQPSAELLAWRAASKKLAEAERAAKKAKKAAKAAKAAEHLSKQSKQHGRSGSVASSAASSPAAATPGTPAASPANAELTKEGEARTQKPATQFFGGAKAAKPSDETPQKGTPAASPADAGLTKEAKTAPPQEARTKRPAKRFVGGAKAAQPSVEALPKPSDKTPQKAENKDSDKTPEKAENKDSVSGVAETPTKRRFQGTIKFAARAQAEEEPDEVLREKLTEAEALVADLRRRLQERASRPPQSEAQGGLAAARVEKPKERAIRKSTPLKRKSSAGRRTAPINSTAQPEKQQRLGDEAAAAAGTPAQSATPTRREYKLSNKLNASSKYYGVAWHDSTKKWSATYKVKHLGVFATEEEAAEAYYQYSLKPEPQEPVASTSVAALLTAKPA